MTLGCLIIPTDPARIVFAGNTPARLEGAVIRDEGPSRKRARLNPDVDIPLSVRQSCVLEELLKARAQTEFATKRANELLAEFHMLQADDEMESDGEF